MAASLVSADAAQAAASRAAEDLQLRLAGEHQYDIKGRQDDEARLLADHAAEARRRGDHLILHTARRDVVLRNTRCNVGPPGPCATFFLAAILPSRHAFLVATEYDEELVFRLIDDRTGAWRDIPSPPLYAPDSSAFVTVDANEAVPPCLQIWRASPLKPVWEDCGMHHPRMHYSRVVRWTQQDRIEVDFWCDAGTCPDLVQTGERHWTGAIVRRGATWRLKVAWPEPERVNGSTTP